MLGRGPPSGEGHATPESGDLEAAVEAAREFLLTDRQDLRSVLNRDILLSARKVSRSDLDILDLKTIDLRTRRHVLGPCSCRLTGILDIEPKPRLPPADDR